jgi:hypothetical protein
MKNTQGDASDSEDLDDGKNVTEEPTVLSS